MIKVSVMYPNKPGVRFDHAYYKDKHLPMVKSLLGPDRGLDAGPAPSGPAILTRGAHIEALAPALARYGFAPLEVLDFQAPLSPAP